jgi:hypothetical protein
VIVDKPRACRLRPEQPELGLRLISMKERSNTSGLLLVFASMFINFNRLRTGFIILLVLTSGHLKSQTADEVLDKYFAAVGTKEMWAQVNSRIDRIETVRVSDMLNHHNNLLRPRKEELTYKFSKRRDSVVWDRFVSVVRTSPGDTASSGFNGTHYWTQKSRESTNDYDYFASTYGKFANLGQSDLLLRADKYSFTGSKTVDKRACHVVTVTIAGMDHDYYFDQETNYLVMYHQSGKDVQTKLSDYRAVDGLMIPFKEEVTSSYGFVSSSVTTEILINPTIDDSYFSKGMGIGFLIK